MKRILFAVKNMNIGGVEKSLLSLLNTIDFNENEVDILLLENNGGFLDCIPPNVNKLVYEKYEDISMEVNLPPIQVIKQHLKNKKIKRAILLWRGYTKSKLLGDSIYYLHSVFNNLPVLEKEYDVAVAYTSVISYLTYVVDFKVNAKKKVGWIHFDISKLNYDKRLFVELHSVMEKIYIVSKDAYNSFESEFPMLKDKCEVKYNVIDRKEILELAEEPVESIRTEGCKTIVTLGRLSDEKGQDIIPEVASLLKNANIPFRWYLIGDGNLRKKIESLSERLNITDQVILLGTKANPYPYLKQADIYVQTSVYEGHCVSILEAIVFGMPIISTEFAGVHEQLDAIDNCFIVDRVSDSIAKAIKECYEKSRNNNK